MQSVAVFVAALLAVATANSVVTSQRLGGNFAYTVGQQPAYAYQAAGYPYAAYNGAVYNGVYNGAYNTPVVYTTAGAVPAVQTVNKVPTTYTYQAAPVSTVVAGTPAATYKTVAGVSPLAYNTLGYNGAVVGYNGLGYAGYPYAAYNGLQGYNGLNGYATVV